MDKNSKYLRELVTMSFLSPFGISAFEVDGVGSGTILVFDDPVGFMVSTKAVELLNKLMEENKDLKVYNKEYIHGSRKTYNEHFWKRPPQFAVWTNIPYDVAEEIRKSIENDVVFLKKV